MARFMKLGLQGVTVVYASGDSGVAGPPGDHNANGCLGSRGKIFSPAWPNKYIHLQHRSSRMLILRSAAPT